MERDRLKASNLDEADSMTELTYDDSYGGNDYTDDFMVGVLFIYYEQLIYKKTFW